MNGTAIVFGGSGFLGSHMVDLLLQTGMHVINIDGKKSGRHKKDKRYTEIEKQIDYFAFIGDDFWEGIQPDYIYNFISTASIADCEEHPLAALDNNVISNAVILESLKSLAEHPFIYLYASSIYAGSGDLSFYGLTKRACEEYTRRWFQVNDNWGNYVVLRYGTIYGPRATGDNSIRKVLERAVLDNVISFYGTGEESREYIYVGDAARYAYDLSIDSKYYGKTVKLTGMHSIKSKQLALLINELLDNRASIEFRNEVKNGHYITTPYRYRSDIPLNYSGDDHTDLGMGLLETIKDLKNEASR